MHHLHPALLLLLLHCLFQSVRSFAPLSLFGSPYLWTTMRFKTHPRAGLLNRKHFASVFGERGERLIEVLGRGHHARRQEQGNRQFPHQYQTVRGEVSDNTQNRNEIFSGCG